MATSIVPQEQAIELGENPVVASPSKPSSNIGDLDRAFQYIQKASHGDVNTPAVDIAAVRRKIDLRLLPVMFLCYTLQYLDKVNLNYAAVMGLREDLHLRGNDFSNASTAFFVAVLIAEIPNGYILQKLPPGKWLGLNVVAWGITTACVAATTNYTTLLVSRIFLGAFESVVAPSLMLIGSQYYTRREQAPRSCFWFCGVGVAQILGGLVSYVFQQVDRDASLNGWRLMFIVLGCITVPAGVLAAWTLPDTPMSVKWLSEAEKVALLNHVSENRTGIENHHFKISQVVELLVDVQIWFLAAMTILISISSGVITSYSATIIRNMGYSPQTTALLNMPSGLVSIFFAIVVGFGVHGLKNGHRWVWLLGCCCFGMTGGALMSFAPTSNRAALLAGVYLVNAITATVIIIYQWAMANVAGHTKRSVGNALIAACLSIGSIIGPETFRAEDAPQYRRAKIIVVATQGAGAALTVLLAMYYVWANRQKERRQKQMLSDGVEMNSVEGTWGNLTNLQNVEFRYVY